MNGTREQCLVFIAIHIIGVQRACAARDRGVRADDVMIFSDRHQNSIEAAGAVHREKFGVVTDLRNGAEDDLVFRIDRFRIR